MRPFRNAGRQNHGSSAEAAAIACDDAGRPARRDDQVLDPAFDDREVGGLSNRGLHRLAIEFAVGLGAWTGPPTLERLSSRN
jgi:hypothetical protein